MFLSLSNFYDQYKDNVPEEIYESLRCKDTSECVITALNYIRKINNFTPFIRNQKSTWKALQLIEKGKLAYTLDKYQYALGYFNCALSFAPQNSDALVQAYFNRAMLFLKAKQPTSCINDIETCLALECPSQVANQLKIMKQSASEYLEIEQANTNRNSSAFEDSFFKLKNGKNTDIPCVTSEIEVIMEETVPKVVAKKDIPVGTVLAVEKPYVSSSSNGTVFICHYCQKISLNLKPCPGCCTALFCDTECQDNSTKEGHNIECKIIEFTAIGDYTCGLPLKAIFKMRQTGCSWKDIITASYDLGVKRMRKSKIAEVFVGGPSLLSSQADKHFIYGEMFNTCMYLANLIHHLDIHTSFFPNSTDEKISAIRATSRIMMHLKMNSARIGISNCTTVATQDKIESYEFPHFGYFPFIGKLKHRCLPNALIVGIKNTAAIVASMPIKQGDEITIAHLDDWYTNGPSVMNRRHKMFVIMKTICNCIICTTNSNPPSEQLSATERQTFSKWLLMHMILCNKQPKDMEQIYTEACKTIKVLCRVPYSREFHSVYGKFVAILWRFQNLKSSNVILDSITDELLRAMNVEVHY